jgi:hypothetical protein
MALGNICPFDFKIQKRNIQQIFAGLFTAWPNLWALLRLLWVSLSLWAGCKEPRTRSPDLPFPAKSMDSFVLFLTIFVFKNIS